MQIPSNLHPSVYRHLAESGYQVRSESIAGAPSVLLADGDSAVIQALIDGFDYLSDAKAERIAAINAECRARLLARFGPAEEQVSRSMGVYGATEQSAMQAGIAATIDASNVASNAVLAAADPAAVEAVSVSWPVI